MTVSSPSVLCRSNAEPMTRRAMMPRHLRDRARHGGGRLAKIGLAVTVLVLGAAILTPAADAATGTGSTQTVTFSLLGELSVTAATLTPNLGSLTAGTTA